MIWVTAAGQREDIFAKFKELNITGAPVITNFFS
jgi:hypothetical protein